jgi:hypothetical protein
MNKPVPQNLPSETYPDTRLRRFINNNFKGYMPSGKRFNDFNKDGILDFIGERDGLSIWYGEGNGNFRCVRINEQGRQDPTTQLPLFPNYNCSGYEIIDLEGDKDPDLIPIALNFGNMGNITEIDLQRLIFINDNESIKRLSSDKYKITKAQMGGSSPFYLQPHIRDGYLCFRGPIELYNWPDLNNIRYITIMTNIKASYWY